MRLRDEELSRLEELLAVLERRRVQLVNEIDQERIAGSRDQLSLAPKPTIKGDRVKRILELRRRD